MEVRLGSVSEVRVRHDGSLGNALIEELIRSSAIQAVLDTV